MFRIFIFLACSTLFLTACGSSEKGMPVAKSCTQESKNTTLFQILQSDYLWNNDLPSSIEPKKYSSLHQLLDAIKSPNDRFSFLLTEQEYQDRYVNAVFYGYGFGSRNNFDKGNIQVLYVYPHSPADQAGLKRGDLITEVNSISVKKLFDDVEQGRLDIADIFGPNQLGLETEISWTSPDASYAHARIQKKEVTTETILHLERHTKQGKDIGYFVFDSFINRSEQDIQQALSELAGVDELVIDLRYNGGGLIRVANQLASQVAWHKVANKVFITYLYNNNYVNQPVLFDLGRGITQLNLDKIYVLTAPGTCSSSELVINSLRPFIDVITIGADTCGKPFGQSPTPICDEVLFAINFQTVNALGFGGYEQGIAAHCPASDLAQNDWGIDDPLLDNAYYHIATGQCQPIDVYGVASSLSKEASPQPLQVHPLVHKWAHEH